MKSRNDESTQRVLLLLKIDANNLYKRISERKNEYLEVFALRRTRTHFPSIFKNRYETTSIEDLTHCGTDLITTLDQFYTMAEEMNWYLFQTQDMPSTVEAYIDRMIRKMGKLLQTLNLFLDAELGIETAAVPTDPSFIDQISEQDFSEPNIDDTPQES